MGGGGWRVEERRLIKVKRAAPDVKSFPISLRRKTEFRP